MKKLDKFFPIVLVSSLVVFFSTVAMPSQVVHALDAKLPAGVWTITVGKGNNVGSKGTLFILGVGTYGTVRGTYYTYYLDSHGIDGKYTTSPFGNKIEWNISTEPNIKYTGYLIFGPGCSQSAGGVCTYTLAGTKFVPGSTSGQTATLSHTEGWYAQITKSIPK